MSLRDDILAAGFDLTPLNRNDGTIAAALSVGRTRIIKTEIGKGSIISCLGLEVANDFLDAVDSLPDFRHAKYLLLTDKLDIGNTLTRSIVDSLVPGLLTSEQAEALKALAEISDPIASHEVTKALEGYTP